MTDSIRRLAPAAWLTALLDPASVLSLAARRVATRGTWQEMHGDGLHHVLVVCLRGALRARFAGAWHRLAAGQAMLLPPHADRALAATRGEIAVQRCACCFTLRRGGERLDLAGAPRALLAGSLVGPLTAILELAVCDQGVRSDQCRRHLLAALLMAVGDSPPATVRGRILTPADRDRIMSLLTAAVGAGPAPGDLADACGLRLDYFTRLFRATFGRAPRRYLLEERMRRARELLLTGRHPVTAVAEAVGCDNPSLFNRQFRQVFACAPGQVRRQGG